jgi:hypothetical protein
MTFRDWLRISREHPCPRCHGRRIPCDLCEGTRINPDYEIPLSETVAEFEEQPSWIPSGPFAIGMVIVIAIMILFIICAPIIKEIS